ncbi:MAG: sigma-70 family RNA polymerase sigma factor, partial [Clostridia bacterium]
MNFFKSVFYQYILRDPKEVNYIGSNEYLPPPLSPEEEARCIENISDVKCRNTLIERNLRLVVYIARRFDNTGVCPDDLISIGTIGLIKAINTFKADKNIKLATYASRCIENEILMYLRKNNNNKVTVSFDEPLNVDWDGNELLLGDILGSDSDSVDKRIEEEVDHQLLHQAMDKLSRREKQIVELRYGLGGKKELTQKEV